MKKNNPKQQGSNRNRNRRRTRRRDFVNKIRISGTITKKDNFVNYVGFPVFGFEFKTKAEDAINEENSHYIHRGIVFDDEDFINKIDIGDRILIDGEIQSRNYSQEHELIDDDVQNAVDLYMNLFDKLPTKKKPTQFIKQPVDWSELFNYNLLARIPPDSAIDEEGVTQITELTPYFYRVDRNGIVSREVDDTVYEVIVHSYELLETDEAGAGDIEDANTDADDIVSKNADSTDVNDVNEVTFIGRISNDPILDIVDQSMITNLTIQNFLKYFENERRFCFLPTLAEGDLAQKVFSDFKRNDFVKITGTYCSIIEKKIIRLRKVSPSGKTRRKRVEIDYLQRFLKIKEITKQSP